MAFSSLIFLLTVSFLSICVFGAERVAFTKDDAAYAYKIAKDFVADCTPRNAGTLRARLAASWIADRVSRCGVDADIDSFVDETPDGKKKFHNVCVHLKAENPESPWIVFMSHFDTAPNVKPYFEGANDSASTTGLLIALTAAIKRAGGAKDYNILFVWTDGEECRKDYSPIDGFHGSRHLLDVFLKKKRTIRAVTCLDMLGDKDLNIMIPANSSPVLKRAALLAAKRIDLGKYIKYNKEADVMDDHSAFYNKGFQAIDFIDFEFGSQKGLNDYWHTPNDTIDKISQESLFISGRIVSEYFNIIDGRYKNKK